MRQNAGSTSVPVETGPPSGSVHHGARAMRRSCCSPVTALCVGTALLLAAAPARADNVKASFKKGTLTLKGDGGDNELTLTTVFALDAGTSVQVTGTGDTTINGAATPAVFDGVVNVNAHLGGG